MRKFILAAALALAFAGPVMANNGNHNNNGAGFNGGAGFVAGALGQFGTQGSASAGSVGGGTAEAYGNGTAGFGLEGTTVGVFQTNQAGAQTSPGNTWAAGNSTGFGVGVAGGLAGAFVGFQGFTGFGN